MSEVPKGIITLWYGAIVDIPAGWHLCDGTAGTPNLRDRFLVGAGSTYAVGASGGAVQHQHTGTTGGHSHALAGGLAVGTGVTFSANTSVDTDTFTTSLNNHLPPYHALCYIMRL